jgi:hypothetical protein
MCNHAWSLAFEMAVFKTIGDYLDGSGWTSALVVAGIASTGRGEAMLHASPVVRSSRAHQVTMACLFILLQRAYKQFIMQDAIGALDTPTDFTSWCESQFKLHPQFKYWDVV